VKVFDYDYEEIARMVGKATVTIGRRSGV